jgi:parallel beta-helix repeat protein
MSARALLLAVVVATALAMPHPATASSHCVFATAGMTMTLTADCTTSTTITIPNGFTLDGAGRTITAVDPVGGSFKGAVVRNAGAVAHVRNLTVAASGLANVCDGGADRLRGIMFEGASGSIVRNTVRDVNQGASGCQEGNSIEVRNAPFDGTHPATKAVLVERNTVSRFQKTGIIANGDVRVMVTQNQVGPSATQANLAANGIQLGFGALGVVEKNNVAGNSWCCVDAVATGILLFDTSAGVLVEKNDVFGNADTGIYIGTDNARVEKNTVSETGPDGFYDVGIGNYGASSSPDGSTNVVDKNTVAGYTEAYDGVGPGKNKVKKPHPQS